MRHARLTWLRPGVGSVGLVFLCFLPVCIAARAADEPSAKVRVTLNGFTVHAQTWDDALQRDGKGDEVFLVAEVKLVDKDGRPTISSSLRSAVMGDTNGWKGRIKAGSRSGRGGLRTGDSYPASQPWVRKEQPAADRPPMLLFEGELGKGRNAVVIVPSIWEWDGGASALRDWAKAAKGLLDLVPDAKFYARAAPRLALTAGAAALLLDVALVLEAKGVLGHKANRPIGMTKGSKGYEFKPRALVLNYDLAKKAVGTDFGKGKGVIELSFKDDDRLRGDYTLYLQVELLRK